MVLNTPTLPATSINLVDICFIRVYILDVMFGLQREASDAERITIEAATQTAGGRYTCEVSADAPSFQTAQVHTHMYVVGEE